MLIHAPLQRHPLAAGAGQIIKALWFGRSVRTQLVVVFVVISLFAAIIAGAVTIYRAGTETRVEIAASMTLAELLVSEAVQLIAQGAPPEPLLNTLPERLRFVRHVRVGVRLVAGTAAMPGVPASAADALDNAQNEQPAGRGESLDGGARAAAPSWFARLIGPPIERHQVPVTIGGNTIATVEITSQPEDEIDEVWDNSVALAAIAGAAAIVLVGLLYLVLGRVLDPLTALVGGLKALEHRDYGLRLARPQRIGIRRDCRPVQCAGERARWRASRKPGAQSPPDQRTRR